LILQNRKNSSILSHKSLAYQQILSSDSDVAILQREAKEAANLWRSLKLDSDDIQPSGDEVHSIDTLLNAVQQAQTR
jgi:hypothetical protein